MSSDNMPVAGEQPPPTNEQATTVGEQPREEQFNPTDALQGINDLSVLDGILWGKDEESPAEPQQPDQQQPDDTEQPAQPEGDQPEESEGQEGEEHPDDEGPVKVSLKVLKGRDRKLAAQAIDLVRQGKAEDLADAWSQVAGRREAEPKPETPSEELADAEPAQPEKAPEITTIEERIKDLRTKRRQAITDYDREAEADLMEQIEDAVLELQSAKEAAREQSARQKEAARDHDRQVEVVKSRYPDSADPESDFSQRLKDRIDLAVYRKDAVLDNPDYLVVLAERTAKELGLTGQAKPSAKPQATAPRAPARPVVGGVAPSSAPQPMMSREQALKAVEGMSREQLEEILFQQG